MTKIDHGPMKLADFETLLMNKYDGNVSKYRTGERTGTKLWVYHRTDIGSLETHVGTWQRGAAMEFDHARPDFESFAHIGAIISLADGQELPDGAVEWELWKVEGDLESGLYLFGDYVNNSKESALHVTWNEEEAAFYTDSQVKVYFA